MVAASVQRIRCAIYPTGKDGPHPEELAKQASRRMAASPRVASILRDAMLRMAPQDEVGAGFTARNLPDGQINARAQEIRVQP
jgi:hypothetical protein